jgi:hypothetical protein
MPSISQAKLDELNEQFANALRIAERNAERANVAERKVQTFDAILEKVIRAANGQRLTEDRGGWSGVNAYGPSGWVEGEVSKKKPTVEERQANEIRQLNERITNLEARLAAVGAVAQFAKAHKA